MCRRRSWSTWSSAGSAEAAARLMKLALVADVHANREALASVLAHAAAQGVDRHAFLGDYVGYGADPGWVVDRIREHVAAGAIAVRGNHDAAVVAGPQPSMI